MASATRHLWRLDQREANGTADSILSIFEAVAPKVGEEFFSSLTSALASTCGVRVAFVSELLADGERAQIVAAYSSGEPVERFAYQLDTTPASVAVNRGSVAISQAVTSAFPRAERLTQSAAQSYAATVLRAASGDVIGILGIAHDTPISDTQPIVDILSALAPRAGSELERRQYLQTLRRSEARLRLLAEYSRDVLFYYQLLPVPGFQYINPAVEQLTGRPPEEFWANPDAALEMLYPEDRSRVRRAIVSGLEDPIVARIRRPDGSMRWIEYRNFPFRDGENRVTAVVGSIRDITGTMEAVENLSMNERYLNTLLQTLPDTFLRIDSNGVMRDYMPGEPGHDLASLRRESIGRHLSEIVPPTLSRPLIRLTKAGLRARSLQRGEVEVAENGQSRVYEVRCVPFDGSEAILILRDFTAVKWHQAEEGHKRLRDELDAKVERMRKNAYGLTYRELAILHLVVEGFADKQIAEALAISTYTVNKHVGNILGKMSAASRTEAGVRAIREGLVS
jgi:PAS domain S-box-containing protein